MTPSYYGNYYPNYPQQQYPQPIQQPVAIPQPQNQILAWVKDEKEAVDYPLTAGQSIFLMNQTEDYLYAKAVDQLGKTTFIKKRLVDESEHKENGNVNVKDYVLREELEDLITDKIQKEVEKKMSEISFKPTKTKKPVIIDEE